MHKSTSTGIAGPSEADRLRRGVTSQVIASAALLAVVLASWPRAPMPPAISPAHRPLAPTVQPQEEKFTPSTTAPRPSARIDWM